MCAETTKSTSVIARVSVGKWFGLFEIALITVAVSLGITFGTGTLTIAWLPFLIFLFSSAGRFHKALDSALGWPSLFLFVFAWIIPPLISRPMWASGIFSYFAGFLIASRLDRSDASVTSLGSQLTSILLRLLLPLAVILLVLTFYSSASNALFWISLVPFAILGWGLPRLNKSEATGPSKLYVPGLGICLLALTIATATVIYLGPNTTPFYAGWLIVLSIVIFIESVSSSIGLSKSKRVGNIVPKSQT